MTLPAADTPAAKHNVVRLATSSSLVASGLMDVLTPAFKKATGYDLEVYAVGSGRALRMGRLGQADVVIAHSPDQEESFVEAGHSEMRVELMKNAFFLIGPNDDPAGVKGTARAADALRKIATRQSRFVSRADGSGNHQKEREVWQSAGLAPNGEWYYESGTEMLPSMQKAAELNAYLLVDSGSWYANSAQFPMQIMVEKDPLLANPYSLIATSTEKHPNINHAGKRRFVEWILSAEGKAAIASLKAGGHSLFELSQ
jgi:tungstate transport system substrate-binding protein